MQSESWYRAGGQALRVDTRSRRPWEFTYVRVTAAERHASGWRVQVEYYGRHEDFVGLLSSEELTQQQGALDVKLMPVGSLQRLFDRGYVRRGS